MSLTIDYNPIYNEVYPDVRVEIEERSKIYGSNTRGSNGTKFDWESSKQSWCEVYHKNKKNKNKWERILGFGNPNDNRFIDMYDNEFPIPKEPILEDVTISNQGKWGALQIADITFRVFTRDQLQIFEENIIKPGSDIQIKYGWSTGRVSKQATTTKIHPKNIDPSEDIYRGITYNFNVEMDTDLTWIVKLQTVGEGFFLSGISANAGSKIVDMNLSDTQHPHLINEGTVIAYARGLSEKIRIDVGRNKSIASHFISSNDTVAYDNTELRYALRVLPASSNKYYSDKNSIDSTYIRKQGDETEEDRQDRLLNDVKNISIHPDMRAMKKVFYIGLSDLIYYYTQAVASRSNKFGIGDTTPRIYMSANYGAWKNANGNSIEMEEQYKFPYGIRSVSIYDPELVSAIPDEVLFNGGIDQDDVYNSAHYSNNPTKLSGHDNTQETGYYRIASNGQYRTQFQRVGNGETHLCNLGEILIGTDVVLELLTEMSQNKHPTGKSIFSFFKAIFDRISYASGGLYKLAFILEETINDKDESISWYNLIDVNFSYTQHQGLKPLRFHTHDDTKPIVRDINLDLTVPNSMANALYVEGRYNMNDVTGESGAILGYLFSDANIDPELKQMISNRRIKAKRLLRYAKQVMGRTGITSLNSELLYSVLKEYRETPPEGSVLKEYNTYLAQTIYPLNLTLTIDGISGFRFGNVVEVDALPSRYYNEDGEARVVFIVTQVNHKITPHDWVTVLETQCRGNMHIKN